MRQEKVWAHFPSWRLSWRNGPSLCVFILCFCKRKAPVFEYSHPALPRGFCSFLFVSMCVRVICVCVSAFSSCFLSHAFSTSSYAALDLSFLLSHFLVRQLSFSKIHHLMCSAKEPASSAASPSLRRWGGTHVHNSQLNCSLEYSSFIFWASWKAFSFWLYL